MIQCRHERAAASSAPFVWQLVALLTLFNRASGFFSISSLLSLSLMIVITICNMAKSGHTVHVLSDCITSYAKKKLPEMLNYYESKGCSVQTLDETMQF